MLANMSTCCQVVRDAINTVSSPVIVIGETVMNRQSMYDILLAPFEA